MVIVAWPWEHAHSELNRERGIRATVSPWQKFSSAMMPTTAKASGQYLNSRLAVTEAAKRGFDEAILLDVNGNIAEASIANVFIVRAGRIVTNDEQSSILLGITRDSVIELARDAGYQVDINRMRVGDLLAADEAFLTGTASEIVPLRELDGKPLGTGSRGAVTELLQAAYRTATSGQDARHEEWLDFAVRDERFDLATIA
jgi:branched-chain amino acid aminotransferase